MSKGLLGDLRSAARALINNADRGPQATRTEFDRKDHEESLNKLRNGTQASCISVSVGYFNQRGRSAVVTLERGDQVLYYLLDPETAESVAATLIEAARKARGSLSEGVTTNE